MRDFSKVYCAIWQSRKFNALTDPFDKLLYIYLLTSPHSNSSGCFDLKPGYACADMECDAIRYRNGMDTLSKAGLIETENGTNTVLITNWVEHNEPANAKHALGIMTQIDGVTSETLKTKRAQEFIAVIDSKKYVHDRACGASLERVCIQYRNPIQTVSAPRPDQDLDRERDQDQTKTETRENSRSPRPVAALKGDGPAASVSRLMETRLMRNTA